MLSSFCRISSKYGREEKCVCLAGLLGVWSDS